MLFSDEYQSLRSSDIMSFLKISNPKKRDAIVADFIATKKKIQQRNLDERAEDLAKEDDLQNLFKPMIQSTEKSTASLQKEFLPLQNELKDLNSKLKETSEEEEKEDRKLVLKHAKANLEDIIASYGMSDPSKLDPYFSIQRVQDGYMMGTKKVTFDDASNIYIDGIKYEGTLGLWKLIMMKKPPMWKDRQDLANYEQILKQTAAITNPRNCTSRTRPYQTYKYKQILESLPLLRQEEEQHGDGIHFLPDNIKALEDRLGILLGEYRAGNRTSTRNEIVPIADELLRRKVISRKEYRDINTFLSESS